jgi:putative methionine-R-sulfoxide reductase with GAF domain
MDALSSANLSQEVLGVLDLDSTRIGTFTEVDCDALTRIANILVSGSDWPWCTV